MLVLIALLVYDLFSKLILNALFKPIIITCIRMAIFVTFVAIFVLMQLPNSTHAFKLITGLIILEGSKNDESDNLLQACCMLKHQID